MEDKIEKFLKRHQGDFYKKRELIHHLMVSQKQIRRFRLALRSLVNNGKVLRIKGGRYSWVGALETVQGRLILNRKGFGFVVTNGDRDIFINSRNLKNALHGDSVEVVILPFSSGSGPEGKINHIIKRANTRFLGTVSREKSGYFLSIDPVTPKRGIRIIRNSNIRMKPGDIIIAEVEDWGQGRIPVQVRAMEKIGSITNPEDDMKVVCNKYDLEKEFPKSVIKELEKINIEAIKREKTRRKDLTGLTCFTIDPKDARDFDDAVSLEINSKGNVVLGIHIADVGFFIKPGSELDREARKRGTSVYFAEGTIHMVPELLSASICSLLPAQERLAISVFIELDRDGIPIGSTFHESIIKSTRRFTYREVQSILMGEEESKYLKLLKNMKAISIKLMKQRQKSGSMDFDIPEPIFLFHNGGIPHEILPSERLESHRIVEEFMLLANRIVAERIPICNDELLPFIYRIHDKPPKEDIKKFLTFLKGIGFTSYISNQISSREFRDILGKVEDSPHKILIENLALRTMTKAIYSTENRGHFGLSFNHYTHFTSPIRRYPDLIVHRLVKKYYFSGSGKNNITVSTLRKISKESTNAEIRAMEAEREYIKLKQIRWLLQHIGDRFSGIISGVTASGFFVELNEALVEGFVPAEWLVDDYFRYDELSYSLIGRKSGKIYQMGKPVNVIIKDVVLEKRQAYFKMVM